MSKDTYSPADGDDWGASEYRAHVEEPVDLRMVARRAAIGEYRLPEQVCMPKEPCKPGKRAL